MVLGFGKKKEDNRLINLERKLRLAKELKKISDEIDRIVGNPKYQKKYFELLERENKIENELKNLGVEENEINSIKGIEGPNIPPKSEVFSTIKRDIITERKRRVLSPFRKVHEKIVKPVGEWKSRQEQKKEISEDIKNFEEQWKKQYSYVFGYGSEEDLKESSEKIEELKEKLKDRGLSEKDIEAIVESASKKATKDYERRRRILRVKIQEAERELEKLHRKLQEKGHILTDEEKRKILDDIFKIESRLSKYGVDTSKISGKVSEKLSKPARGILPEDARVLKAIAWGKAQLDVAARKKREELKRKVMEGLKHYDEKIKKLEGEKEKILKELRDINKEMKGKTKDEKDLIKDERGWELLREELRRVQSRINELEREKIRYKEGQDLESKLPLLERILSDDAKGIAERAIIKYGIRRPENRAEIRQALDDFAHALAARLIETNFKKTIYRWGARPLSHAGYGFVALSSSFSVIHENLSHILIGTIGGAIVGGILSFLLSKIISGLISPTWFIFLFAIIGFLISFDAGRGVLFSTLFSSVVFGVFIIYAMNWFVDKYPTVGKNWIIIIISVFVTLMITLSEVWSR